MLTHISPAFRGKQSVSQKTLPSFSEKMRKSKDSAVNNHKISDEDDLKNQISPFEIYYFKNNENQQRSNYTGRIKNGFNQSTERSKTSMNSVAEKLKNKLNEQKYISGINKRIEAERKGLLDRHDDLQEDEKNMSKRRKTSRSNGKVRVDVSKKKFKRTNSLTALKQNPKNQIFRLHHIYRICRILSAYQETFELAVSYYTRLSPLLATEKEKDILMFTAIILALKMNDSYKGRRFFKEVVKWSNSKADAQNIEEKSRKQLFVEKILQKNRKGIKSMKKLLEFFNSYKGHNPAKEQLVQMQIYLCRKLKFKLTHPTLSSSLHQLTELWDNFIRKRKQKCSLLFKEGSKEKLKYLSKITQLLLIQYQNNDREKNKQLILSGMHIVLQITSQSKETMESKIQRMKEAKSTFSDLSGVKGIFIDFAKQINVQIEQIIQFHKRIIDILHVSLTSDDVVLNCTSVQKNIQDGRN